MTDLTNEGASMGHYHAVDELKVQGALAAVLVIAPTEEIAQAFVNIVMRMKDANEPPADIVRALVNSLADGVNHYNWPKVGA